MKGIAPAALPGDGMLKLNFHHLYYFHVIAEEQQVARAARRLRIGQPTLSTQLKQFEEFLGYRLFDRKRGQAISLTPKGAIMREYAREIFRLADEMMAATRGIRADERLQLRVGALDWLPKQEVSQIIARVTRELDCFVSVYEDTAQSLARRLDENQFDLIITNSPIQPPDAQTYRAHRIAVLPLLICGAPRFGGLTRAFPESLKNQPLILPTRHGRTRHLIEDFLASRGIPVRLVGEAQDGELLRRAALSGEALVPLARSTVQGDLIRGELIAVGELSGVHDEIWLVSTPRLVEHPAVRFLMTTTAENPRAA